jgi:hypothetical protein
MKPGHVLLACLCTALIAAFTVDSALAQAGNLTIGLHRDFGYGLGDQIQGNFTISARGPDDLVRVSFLLDGQEIGAATQAPFKISFNTDQYSTGRHVFSATGRTASGQELTSNTISVQIVSGQSSTLGLIVAVGVVLGIILLATLLPLLMSGRRRRPVGQGYGMAGGAICPKCGRPFGLSLFSPNLLTRKLDRCPYCGKWSAVRCATPAELQAAEQTQQGAAAAAVPLARSPEEALRRRIEESKYR